MCEGKIQITAKAEYWCYDEYETYVRCPFCAYDNNERGLLHPDDGDSFECGYCDKYFEFGIDYIVDEPK